MAKRSIDVQAEEAKRAAAQQYPEFLEWLAQRDSELAAFFTDDVPGMPNDPWTMDGLRHAERIVVDKFWAQDPNDFGGPDRRARFQRFYGEMLVRFLDGRWVYAACGEDGEFVPVIVADFATTYWNPATALSSALDERTGDQTVVIFGRLAQAHYAWAQYGRKSMEEWEEFSVKNWKEVQAIEDQAPVPT